VTEPDPGSNPTDDGMISVLEDHGDDPVQEELIDGLDEDERFDLVTLAWVGRGDGSLADWDELREEAARSHDKRVASYLPICSASRCCRTIWRRRCRSSAIRAGPEVRPRARAIRPVPIYRLGWV
jgi:Protein of unknown function (DUF3775)